MPDLTSYGRIVPSFKLLVRSLLTRFGQLFKWAAHLCIAFAATAASTAVSHEPIDSRGLSRLEQVVADLVTSLALIFA